MKSIDDVEFEHIFSEDKDLYFVLTGSPNCTPCKETKEIISGIFESIPEIGFYFMDLNECDILFKKFYQIHELYQYPKTAVLDKVGNPIYFHGGVLDEATILAVIAKTQNN